MSNFTLTMMFRKRADIPIYSFAKHAREIETTSIYSPHVLILEGIFALYDPRVLKLLDMKVCYVIPELRMRTRTLKTKLWNRYFVKQMQIHVYLGEVCPFTLSDIVLQAFPAP